MKMRELISADTQQAAVSTQHSAPSSGAATQHKLKQIQVASTAKPASVLSPSKTHRPNMRQPAVKRAGHVKAQERDASSAVSAAALQKPGLHAAALPVRAQHSVRMIR